MNPAQLERLEFDRLTEWSKEAVQLLNLAIDRPLVDQAKEYQVPAYFMYFFSFFSHPLQACKMAALINTV
jgi:hypothetical protein